VPARRVLHAQEDAVSRKALLGISLALLFAARPAEAIDLTGTWEGSSVCKRFSIDGQSSTEKTKERVLFIAQAGATFDASIDFLEFRGATIDDPADGARRGQAALVTCLADAIPLDGGVNEIIQLKAKVDAAKGTGTLTGVSVHEHGMNGIMTCRYKFKRTSTTAGKFTSCDEL
jgi:hypothetical protein